MRNNNPDLIWVVEVPDYEFNGVITASVNNENGISVSENDQLAVLVNGECRGVTQALYCPITDEYVFSLMVYGNQTEGENMSLSYYSAFENKVYENIQSIEFESDMVVGNAIDSYVVNIYDEIPDTYSLGKAYPNPFNPSTNIKFSIAEDGYTNISVYNLNGRKIEDLINDYKSSGNYQVEWNANNVSSGVYFIKMDANGFSSTQKIMLIK